jgi:hypothetical protein
MARAKYLHTFTVLGSHDDVVNYKTKWITYEANEKRWEMLNEMFIESEEII